MTYAWIDLGDGREVYRRVPEPVTARSDLSAPRLATDGMNETQHPCDGRFYTSKSAFREVTKAHGCIEMGNDPARLRQAPKPKPDRQAIRASLQRAKARLT